MTSVMTNPAVDEAVSIFERSSGLSTEQAKTVFYWCCATYGLSTFNKFPLLVFEGPFGTGKTTSLECAAAISSGYSGRLSSGKESEAVLRDSLVYQGTTAIDEADGIDESLLIARHSKTSSSKLVNRQKRDGGYEMEEMNLFGATILHRRRPFRDSSVRNSSIIIKTQRNDDYGPITDDEIAELANEMKDLLTGIEWEEIPRGLDRAEEVWTPLKTVAKHFGDNGWVDWADQQIATDKAIARLGQEFEHSYAVLSALLSLSIDGETIKERVRLSHLRESLNEDGHELSPQQVSSECNTQGFDVKQSGGQMYVYTGGLDQLLRIADGLGFEDSWLEERRQEKSQDF